VALDLHVRQPHASLVLNQVHAVVVCPEHYPGQEGKDCNRLTGSLAAALADTAKTLTRAVINCELLAASTCVLSSAAKL